ncbi:hypothetical protein [Numidum massiliense]|uniref:hypothetical protein n=1 Tax=Numidum massiliense TaxID=1522315 RepID=UPI0006D5B0AF|nr:hypothetical protein [Numidum massiliense]
MAQYQITVDQELLHQLFSGNSRDAGVAKLLESVVNDIPQRFAGVVPAAFASTGRDLDDGCPLLF